VDFDLNNACFSLGKIVLRQMIGIPMGSPISPSLAILSCARQEHFVKQSLGSDVRYIHGMRYIDDSWIALIYPRDSMARMFQLRQKYFECYNPALKVEIEGKGERVKFLDKWIIWNGKKFIQQHRGKNWESMMEDGKRKFFNVIPVESYNSMTQKKGLIMGILSRVNSNSTLDRDVFFLGWGTLFELLGLGYSVKMLCECCFLIGARYERSVWKQLSLFFKWWVNTSCPSPIFKRDLGLKFF